MSERTCDKCGETVPASKAFCPACGHALVEEEVRTDTTEFKLSDGTMQFSQSMYDGMLSDMGLNISKTSEELSKDVSAALEQIESAKPQPAAPAIPAVQTTLKPAAPPAATPAKSKTRMWLIIGGLVVVLWLVALILVVAIYLMRGRLT